MSGPIRLPSVAERDAAIAHLLWATPPYIDPATGAPYVFEELPEVYDPIGDADMGDYEDDEDDELEAPADDGHDNDPGGQ